MSKFVPVQDNKISETLGKTRFDELYQSTFEVDKNHCPKAKDGIHMFKYDRYFNPLYCRFCKIKIEELK